MPSIEGHRGPSSSRKSSGPIPGKDLTPIPEKLLNEGDLGEERVRKEKLKDLEMGAVLVLRRGVPWLFHANAA